MVYSRSECATVDTIGNVECYDGVRSRSQARVWLCLLKLRTWEELLDFSKECAGLT